MNKQAFISKSAAGKSSPKLPAPKKLKKKISLGSPKKGAMFGY
jgi:hypothetical protein